MRIGLLTRRTGINISGRISWRSHWIRGAIRWISVWQARIDVVPSRFTAARTRIVILTMTPNFISEKLAESHLSPAAGAVPLEGSPYLSSERRYHPSSNRPARIYEARPSSVPVQPTCAQDTKRLSRSERYRQPKLLGTE